MSAPTGYNIVQTPKVGAETRQRIDSLRGQVQPGATAGIDFYNQLAKGGSEDFWNQLEAPAYRKFAEAQGSTASRFSGFGTGARRSSGFYNDMASQSAGLAESLQQQRLGLQQGAIDKLMGMYNDLVSFDPYDYLLQKKKKKNRWGNVLEGASMGAQVGSQIHPIYGTLGGGAIGALLGGFAE